MTKDGFDKDVDSVLRLFNVKLEIDIDEIKQKHDKIEDLLIANMTAIGLLKETTIEGRKRTFILDKFGHEIRSHGSWTAYLSDKLNERRLAASLTSSSINSNQVQKRLLLATTVFAFLTLCISIADYFVHRNELHVARRTFQHQFRDGKNPKQDQPLLQPDSAKDSTDSLSNENH